MTFLLRILLLVLAVTGAAALLGWGDIAEKQWYGLLTGSLLAVGLYASTYGIVLEEARRHVRLIFTAVTVGVLLKALFIGGLLALIFRDPFFLVLGVAVAQIDPLSVAGLMKGTRLSTRARTVLAAWSSFDDPITVILSLYAPVVVAWLGVEGAGDLGGAGGGVMTYLGQAGMNLVFAAVALAVWLAVRRYFGRGRVAVRLALVLLPVILAVAVHNFWMLGVALVGLFWRPDIGRLIDRAVNVALAGAAVLLGILLVNGVDIIRGLALGLAAYCSQIIVGFLLTRKLPRKDRLHISFAQQNGITAIILALLFEPVYPGTVAIVAPAILAVNLLHHTANKALDAHLKKDHQKLTARHLLDRLKTHLHKI